MLEGRVKRRIRRNRLSEELNSVAWEKREEKRERIQERKIELLQEELRVKDLELQALREDMQAQERVDGVPATPQSQQVVDLERSISELQSELHKSFHENVSSVGQDEVEANWTLAAKDPWDEDAHMTEMDTLHEDSEMAASTPHHRQEQMRRSMPSPPETVHNTPSRGPAVHIFTPITPSSLRANTANFNHNLGLSATFNISMHESHSGDTTVPNSPVLSATTEAATELMEQEDICMQLPPFQPVNHTTELHSGDTTVPNSPTLSATTEAATEIAEQQDICMQLPAFQPSNYRTIDTGIQTSFSLLSSISPPPPARVPTNIVFRKGNQIDAKAQAQIYDLTEQLATLTETLVHNTTTQERLAAKLEPWVSPVDASHTEALDFALDSVLTHLALTQESAHDHATRFDALTKELCGLFPSAVEGGEEEHDESGAAAEAVLNLVRDQFRAARLNLEYLFPGEQAEGFDNSKVLSMLIDRLKTLNSQTTQQKGQIDQYAEQEVTLKEQLTARVDATKTLQGMLSDAQSAVTKLEEENNRLFEEGKDLDENHDRLKKVLESYRAEIRGLENCIHQLDDERSYIVEEGRRQLDEMRCAANERIGQEVNRSSELRTTTEAQARLIADLEGRLASALSAGKLLKDELQRLTETNAKQDGPTMEQFELFRFKAYEAVTDRDKIISSMHAELQTLTTALANSQEEIERLREGLSRAHETISAERLKGRQAMARMKSEMRRVIEETRLSSNNGTPVREIVASVPSTGFLRGVAMAGETSTAAVEVDRPLEMNTDTSMHDASFPKQENRIAPTMVERITAETKVEVRHMPDKYPPRRRSRKGVEEDGREEQGRRKRRQTFGVGRRE